MTRPRLRRWLLLPLFIWGAARAACSLPASSANLGSVTSFVLNNQPSTASGEVHVNCGAGSVASLLSSNYIRLQLTGARQVSGGRTVLQNGSDGVPVQLCTSANCATELSVGGSGVTYGSRELINLVGIMGNLNFTLRLYLRTLPGVTVRAGTYSGTLNVLTQYNICTSIGVGGMCLPAGMKSGAVVVPMSVTLVVTNDCIAITAPNLNFGSAPLVASFNDVTQSISATCTKGSSYSVGFSNGAHAIGNVRNMANGSLRLSYEIYQANGSLRWGSSGVERVASAAAISVTSDGLTRVFNYVAKIVKTQNTPPPGVYTDSVVIDLAF
ncbi:spore coat U domain-containing protein [Candidatus Sodalis endolongispinus]|uniref:Spore coat U domain-containing protein n=1 Tax=Candidatus Sodalis endolongispinus TaxID=2812662 RepID=A0ABS5YCZ8_9GAMM|nr:spore coat U domain-containing protein [Candidatus Sodalis endolongispinus]MBT9432920.1 spore coat U domain-containing protein [Candidatus Sodalis endolongispinus]